MIVAFREPVQYLKQFIAGRVGRVLEPQDVVYILKTASREILPNAGLRGRCPQLELFSDWTAHNELDRSAAGQAAIARIAEALPYHGQDGRDEKWLEEEVNGGIAFWTLRLELLAVCRRFGLPEQMFTTWEAWQLFALPLAFEVSGRPVRLGQHGKAAQSAKDRISKSGLHSDHRPHTLTLVHIEQAGPQTAGWRWQIESPNVKVLVQVLLGGFRLGDFPTPPGWQSPL